MMSRRPEWCVCRGENTTADRTHRPPLANVEDPMPEGFLTGDTTDTTWIKPLAGAWKEVTYAAVDGLAIFEGCIILGTVEEAKAAKEFIKNNPGITMNAVEQFGTGIKGKQFRWKGNILPYVIDPALPNQQRVTDAIKHWEENTAI